MVGGQSPQVSLTLLRCGLVPGSSVSQRTIKGKVGTRHLRRRSPEKALRSFRCGDGGPELSTEEASLQLPRPIEEFAQRHHGVVGKLSFRSELAELLVVEASKRWRRSPQRPDKGPLSRTDRHHETEPRLR